MDLTQPMILANAMIFHNQFSQQMTQQLNSSTILYQPSFHHQNHPINVNPCYYRENSIIVEPIKETINTPMILEDLISDKIIFKGVLGILKEKEEHFLIVSAFLNLPNSHQCQMIKKIIEDKIQQHCKDIDSIYLVFSGNINEEIMEEFKKGVKGEFIQMKECFILQIKRDN